MSNWETKSNYSSEAANKLIDVGLFNPSVHSSYYSCVQYVYHIMYVFFNEDVASIETGSDGVSQNSGTHQWLKKYIYDSIKAKSKPDAIYFRNKMGDLSGFRVQADYKYNLVDKGQANQCKEMADKMIVFLKEHYDL
jgi:hypothetical protein